MNKPILFCFQDGPTEKPNGFLLVEPLHQGRQRNFFICRVVKVLASSGRTAAVGDVIETEGSKLALHWVE
jgi:hypothetical protein